MRQPTQLVFLFTVIVITAVYARHTKTVEMPANSTKCYEFVGNYGKFKLWSLNKINASLYDNDKLKDKCGNQYSIYCTLHGEKLDIIEDDHTYSVCITTHNVTDYKYSSEYTSAYSITETESDVHSVDLAKIDIIYAWYPSPGAICWMTFSIFGAYCSPLFLLIICWIGSYVIADILDKRKKDYVGVDVEMSDKSIDLDNTDDTDTTDRSELAV